MKFILAVIGMLFFLEGLPYFLFPSKMKKFLEEIRELEYSTMRLMGLTLLILGLIITFISQKI